MPGGHTIRSKPLGEPSGLRPGTRRQPPGIVTQPDTVHAICPCAPVSRWRGSRAFAAIGRARMMVATSKAFGMIVRPAVRLSIRHKTHETAAREMQEARTLEAPAWRDCPRRPWLRPAVMTRGGPLIRGITDIERTASKGRVRPTTDCGLRCHTAPKLKISASMYSEQGEL
jgi:hypothetical protein